MMAYRPNQNWSHEVVKFTASRLTAKFYAIEQEQEAYALFKKSYEQVCALVKQGHELPKVHPVVMAKKVSDKATAYQYLSQMKQRLGA